MSDLNETNMWADAGADPGGYDWNSPWMARARSMMLNGMQGIREKHEDPQGVFGPEGLVNAVGTNPLAWIQMLELDYETMVEVAEASGPPEELRSSIANLAALLLAMWESTFVNFVERKSNNRG